jgi:quinolinate synthase
MAMNGMDNLLHVLKTGDQEIHVDAALARRAKQPLDRMLSFTAAMKR